jgi:hypothetical protein
MENRVLVKLRPSSGLRAAESRVNLRPLYDRPVAPAASFGFEAAPQWFIAELPEGAGSPWDAAHARVAGQLGVAESDVIFAEPDLIHDIYLDDDESRTPEGFGAAVSNCTADEQDPAHNKARGADAIWHLDDEHTQLRSARGQVKFRERRTRIGHLDTGFFPGHVTTPVNLRHDLARSFVDGDGTPDGAVDPYRNRLFDNSGHGTGTLSILAIVNDSMATVSLPVRRMRSGCVFTGRSDAWTVTVLPRVTVN